MRWAMLCAVGLSALTTVSVDRAAAQENDDLRALAQRYWDEHMERHPVFATSLGDYRFNDRLGDLGRASRQEWESRLDLLLRDLQRLRVHRLSPADRLTYELLVHTIRRDVTALALNKRLMPFDPLYGPHIRFALMVESHPFRDAGDFHAYIKRLRAFPEQVSQLIGNLRFAARADITSPRVLVEKVIPQIRVGRHHPGSYRCPAGAGGNHRTEPRA